jgi:hypothetical protein
MTFTRLLSLVAFIALVACKPKPPEVAAEPQEIAAPFDAEALRAGLPLGTTVLYRLSTPDGTTGLSLWEVVLADEQGLTVHSRLVDDERNDISPILILKHSWASMEAESTPAPGSEVLKPTQQPMALGTLRVTTHVMPDPAQEGAFMITTYSEDHPGPAVKMESELNGEITVTMEAIEWTVGR